MSERSSAKAREISTAAIRAAEANIPGGGLLIGEARYAVVVVVHQLGTDPGGLAISVQSNLAGQTDSIKQLLREGLRVVEGHGSDRKGLV